MDWHTGKVVKKEVCVVEDDSSRYILAGGEFDAATAEISINLVQEVLDNYIWIRKVEQVITDRGTQFYANKKDKNDEANKTFDEALKLQKAPGFEIIFAFAGLIMITHLLKRKR